METDYFHYTPALITLLAISANFVLTAGVSFVLLVITALLAGAEVAVLNLSSTTIELLEDKNDRRSEIIKEYIKDPERLHLTVSVFTVFIMVISFLLFLPHLQHFTVIENSNWLLLIIIAFFFSLIFLIFTELIPRFFSRIAYQYIYAFVFPVKFIETLFSPVSYMIENLTGKHTKRLQANKYHISIEDISSALELTSHSNSDDEDILKGLVNFGNIDVQKILKPRIDVIAVDKETDAEELYQIITESGYSRIPVFSEAFDNIVGILYVKDLLPHFRELNQFDWNSLIRPPYFVPETKKVKELLKELQIQKIHMAVVIDEYGGTTGIVTLEDILEEIVGEIADESDEDEQTFQQVDKNTFIFDGITLLTDFYRITQSEETIFDEVRGEADTIAGLIMELKGGIPENGDEIHFTPFRFIIELVDNRRIKQIKVIIHNDKDTEDEKS